MRFWTCLALYIYLPWYYYGVRLCYGYGSALSGLCCCSWANETRTGWLPQRSHCDLCAVRLLAVAIVRQPTFPHCDEYDPVINAMSSNFVCRELRRLASHCLAPFTHTSQVCVFFVCVSLFSLFFVFVFLCVDQIYLAIYKRQQQDNTIRSQCPEFVMSWDCLVVEVIFTSWRSRRHWSTCWFFGG